MQTVIGGDALFQLFEIPFPSIRDWPYLGSFFGFNLGQGLCLLIFWLFNILIVAFPKGAAVNVIKHLEFVASPMLLLMGVAIFAWSWASVGSLSKLIDATYQIQEAKLQQEEAGTTGQFSFWRVAIANLTAVVAIWSTLANNVLDFTRYAKSQRHQILGQVVGFPLTNVACSFLGILMTSAAYVVFQGELIFNPVDLASKFESKWVVAIMLIFAILATLTTNIAANMLSPAHDFSNLLPRFIGLKLGILITAICGMLFMPWKLISNPNNFVFRWLIGSSSFMGALTGVMLSDFFLVKRMHLQIDALYSGSLSSGSVPAIENPYRYYFGFNLLAFVALLLGSLPILPGFFSALGLYSQDVLPSFMGWIYDASWFVTFGLSFVSHFLIQTIVKKIKKN